MRAPGTYRSPSYFTLLGIETELDRVIREKENWLNGAEPVVVLSDSLWQRQFAGARNIIGPSIQLNDRAWLILWRIRGLKPGLSVAEARADIVRSRGWPCWRGVPYRPHARAARRREPS